LLHQVGVFHLLLYDARNHEIETFLSFREIIIIIIIIVIQLKPLVYLPVKQHMLQRCNTQRDKQTKSS